MLFCPPFSFFWLEGNMEPNTNSAEVSDSWENTVGTQFSKVWIWWSIQTPSFPGITGIYKVPVIHKALCKDYHKYSQHTQMSICKLHFTNEKTELWSHWSLTNGRTDIWARGLSKLGALPRNWVMVGQGSHSVRLHHCLTGVEVSYVVSLHAHSIRSDLQEGLLSGQKHSGHFPLCNHFKQHALEDWFSWSQMEMFGW